MSTFFGRSSTVGYSFGIFICVISSNLLTASANDVITITPRAAQIKAVDSKIIFTCTVGLRNDVNENESETWPDIVWLGPGKHVISESKGRVFVERIDMNRLRLYITQVKESDSGQYTCSVHVNGAHSNNPLVAHSRLYLYEEIKFVDFNSNITRKAGTNALVNCMASGKPEPEVSWRFKGKRIVFADNMKYSQEKRGLRIFSLQPEDHGSYECRAEVVSQGNLKVQTINLNVVYPPVLTQSPESTMTAIKGSDVTFHCQGHGNPAVEYRWFKEVLTADGIVERYSMSADDETNTTMDSSSSLSADGSLLMRSVDLTDDGKYVCSISNNLGATETTVNFEVLVRPQVDKITWQGQDGNITLIEGESMELSCSAKGRPQPEVYWTVKEPHKVESADEKSDMTLPNAVNNSHVLSLLNVTRGDSKVYTCTAVNSVGVHTLDVALLVNYAPTIIVNNADRAARVWSQQVGWSQYGWYGQNRTFSCHAYGRPTPDVVWLRGDAEYDVTADEIYSITETRPDDETVISQLQIRIPAKGDTSVYSRYSCVAKNSIGFDNFTAQLAEALVPDMPRNLTVMETTSRSVRLSVTSSPSSLAVDDIVTSHVALGGLDITSWVVTYEAASGKSVGFVTSLKLERADDMRVANLQPNTTYIIKVSAVNVVGVGTAAKILVTTIEASNDDRDFMSAEVQSDDGRHIAKYGAVNSGSSGNRLKSRTRASLDDEELFSVVDWGNTSAVLVVVGAVLLTTVVAAVLALVLHTRRRMVNNIRTTANDRGPVVLNNKRERTTGKACDLNEVTSVKVSEGRDVDNLTLQIRGRRPPSPGTSIPDELYRSLGRSTKKTGSHTPQYGSAVPSPRLGARPGFGPASSSGVTSPLPSRAVATCHQTAQLAAAVDVSSAQKNAWNDMIRGADQQLLEAVNIDMSLVTQQLEEAANDDDTKNVINNEGVSDSDEEDDSDVGYDHDDDDELFDQQQQPVFEGKSFLSYSP